MKNNELNLNSHVPLVGILADDFTSAADGAGPFVGRGYNSLVNRRDVLGDTVDADDPIKSSSGYDVFSWDVGSRLLSVEDASRVMEQAIAKLLPCKLLLKTIDSTLRGNIKGELKTAIKIALSSGRCDKVVIAPAFPSAGRITKGGVQFVDGVPVSKSSYGRDPVHPATTSSILDLIDPCFGKPVVIPHNADISGVNCDQNNAKILILDADNQKDLSRQVANITNPESVLWIGSPGLAMALSDLLPIKAQPNAGSKTKNITQTLNCKRVLVLIGSANRVSRDQCAYLLNSDVPVFERALEILDPKFSKSPIVCLTVPTKRSASPEKVKVDLINEAKIVMHSGGFDTVIATGGETMVAFMDAYGIDRMSLEGELEPGFPYGISLPKTDGLDKGAPALMLAMKAGGFGSPTILLDVARNLLSTSIEITNAN